MCEWDRRTKPARFPPREAFVGAGNEVYGTQKGAWQRRNRDELEEPYKGSTKNEKRGLKQNAGERGKRNRKRCTRDGADTFPTRAVVFVDEGCLLAHCYFEDGIFNYLARVAIDGARNRLFFLFRSGVRAPFRSSVVNRRRKPCAPLVAQLFASLFCAFSAFVFFA